MARGCRNGFDEALISGYLDQELTQAAEQKVRIHLEDCAGCRALLDELRQLREATMTTQFVEPSDTEWNERPRGAASRGLRSLGWAMAIIWLVVTVGFGLWQMWQAPQSAFERLLIFGGITGFALLFLSVLIDRIRAAKTDRYREVEK